MPTCVDTTCLHSKRESTYPWSGSLENRYRTATISGRATVVSGEPSSSNLHLGLRHLLFSSIYEEERGRILTRSTTRTPSSLFITSVTSSTARPWSFPHLRTQTTRHFVAAMIPFVRTVENKNPQRK